MRASKRILYVFLIMIFTNCSIIFPYFRFPVWLGVVCGLLLAAGFVAFNLLPVYEKGISVRLTRVSRSAASAWRTMSLH